jgi:antitoxin (DNA-binding transcriptional repressor) of toxin-antitoxin stability system
VAGPARRVDLAQAPDLLRLVEEVERTGQPSELCRDGELVAVLVPVASGPPKPSTRPRRRTGRIGPDDPLIALSGIGQSGLGNVSANKHEHLAEAYYPKPQQ